MRLDWTSEYRYPDVVRDASVWNERRILLPGLGGRDTWFLGERVVHQWSGRGLWIAPMDPPDQVYSRQNLTEVQWRIARRGWHYERYLDRSISYEEFVSRHLKVDIIYYCFLLLFYFMVQGYN